MGTGNMKGIEKNSVAEAGLKLSVSYQPGVLAADSSKASPFQGCFQRHLSPEVTPPPGGNLHPVLWKFKDPAFLSHFRVYLKGHLSSRVTCGIG